MTLTFGFFNSVNGDRTYDADTISNMFKGLISDGIYESVANAFIVTPSSGLTLSVGSGRAIVGDRWVENDADMTITLNAAHVTLNRYTAIVLRKSTTTRDISIVMIDGTPASSPVKPSIVRNTTTYDILLAYVYVAAGATSITGSNITDMRANTSVCGFVTGLITQVDTTELFNQYSAAYEENLDNMEAWEAAQKAAFDTWFDDLTDELRVDTYISRTSGTVVTSRNSTKYIDLPTSLDYETTDILEVYANGLYLDPSTYEVQENEVDGGYMIYYSAGFPTGQTISFMCLKSEIGQQAATI